MSVTLSNIYLENSHYNITKIYSLFLSDLTDFLTEKTG